MSQFGRPAARRTVAATGAATLIATLGLTAWIGTASADACPAWTAPKGDSSTNQAGLPETGDTNMDIVKSSFGTVGDSIVGVITTDGLQANSSDAGDEFGFTFTVAGVAMTMYTDRARFQGQTAPAGFGADAGFLDSSTATPKGVVTATYDVKTKAVTLTGKISELAKASGKPVAGQAISALSSYSSNQVDTFPVTPYDDSATKLTTVVGAECEMAGGAPAPSGSATGAPSASATPSATASASPSSSASPTASASPSGSASPAPSGPPAAGAAGLPAAGCFTYPDVKADAVVSPLVGGPGPAEADLDLLGITLQSTPEMTRAFLKVDKLATRPSSAPGHSFTAVFTAGKKVVQLVTTGYDPAAFGTAIDTLAGATATAPVSINPQSRMLVDGTRVASTIKGTFDIANSTVTIAIPTAELTKATAGEFVAGAVLTAVVGRSGAQYVATGLTVDTTAAANAAASTAKETWTVGDNACFSSPTTLTNVGAIGAQFGDVAKVAVKLADGAGAPLAGQPIVLSVAGTTATVTTGADGVARLAATVKSTAGTATLTAAFAGAGAFDKSDLTMPFKVALEKTVLSAKGGTGAVTATLLDDDRKPVAGQTVTFTQGSVKRTAKTGANGVAKAGGFLPGQAVTVTYAGLAGKYAAAKTSTRA